MRHDTPRASGGTVDVLHVDDDRAFAEGRGWTVEATDGEHGGARTEARGVETVGSDSG